MRRRNLSATEASTAAAGSSTPEEGATEVIESEAARTCPSCGAEVGTSEQFCTACGVNLEASQGRLKPPASAAAEEAVPLTLPLPVASESARARQRGRAVVSSRRALLAVLVVLLVGALVAVALLARAWQSESSGKHRAQRELAATRADLASAQAALAATRKQLTATTALSKHQAVILGQAAVVLRKVDPLLTNVDHLQQVTGQMQSQQSTFTADAETLIGDTVTLVNYLLSTDPTLWDVPYLESLLRVANGHFSTVRADETALTGYDSNYGDASRVFNNQASGFTAAVRRLQRQLSALRHP